MPNCRVLVLAVPVVLLLGCGSAATPPPVPPDAAAGEPPATQVDAETAGESDLDSGAPGDAEASNEAGTGTGTQVDSGSPTGIPWTLIALPDTQYYSSTYPQIFDAQANWIISQATALNIRYVVHEGDIVDNDVDGQWTNASHSMHLLDLNVPYVLAIGNHDYPGGGGATSRDTTLFDSYFSLSSLDWMPSFKAPYEPGSLANSYSIFQVNGQSWLIILWNSARGMPCLLGRMESSRPIRRQAPSCSRMPICTRTAPASTTQPGPTRLSARTAMG